VKKPCATPRDSCAQQDDRPGPNARETAPAFGKFDTSAWIGGFSSAPNTKPASELVPVPEKAKEKLKLLWISVGNKDGLIGISQGVHAYLKAKKRPAHLARR
jgi:hypothetical protein